MTDLVIRQGATFQRVIRWQALPFIYKPIQSISNGAPTEIGCTGHGVPDGWPVAIVSVQGMVEINAKNTPPRLSNFIKSHSTGANTLELNSVNSSGFTPYVSGGFVQYYTPVDLTSYTAKLSVMDRTGGTVLFTLNSPTDIVLDNTAKTITVTINAAVTAALAWTQGVYELELSSGASPAVVTVILSGDITVERDITP
jgi:hypothetical protein